jgi:hypothetical protein
LSQRDSKGLLPIDVARLFERGDTFLELLAPPSSAEEQPNPIPDLAGTSKAIVRTFKSSFKIAAILAQFFICSQSHQRC